jgi:hypothetical protein
MLKKREVEIEDDKKTLNKIQPKKNEFFAKRRLEFLSAHF